MNILFLNREFYEYDTCITKYLKTNNEVYSYSILPHKSLAFRSGKLFELLLNYVFEKSVFYSKICKLQQDEILSDLRYKHIKIDAVFVLAGQQLRRDFLDELRKMYPDATFVWYMWDNIKNIAEYKTNKSAFDKIISFDCIEAKNENLYYLPLFYLTEEINKKSIDIIHIGYAYPKRVSILSRIIQQMKNKKYFIYLKSNFTNHIKYIFYNDWINMFKYIHYKSISTNEAYKIMSLAKCVIDIPADNQTGLTMRTIEALGAHTKIITTNKCIKLYDFYNSNNIFVIEDEKKPVPGESFFKNSYTELPHDVLKKYSFESWINEIQLYLKH